MTSLRSVATKPPGVKGVSLVGSYPLHRCRLLPNRRPAQGSPCSPARPSSQALRRRGPHHRAPRRVPRHGHRRGDLSLLQGALRRVVPRLVRSPPHHLRQTERQPLEKIKESIWQELLSWTPHDPAFALCDSMPLPACLFARAYRCRRFRGEAAFGKNTLLKQTFYGFRIHARVCWPGLITRFSVASANVHELSVVPEITEG